MGKMKKFALLTLIISMLVVLAACGGEASSTTASQEEKKTIKIGYLPITHAVPLFMENEQTGKFENFELELIKFGSWPELMDALNTGRIDGASVLITLAMKAKSQGIDLEAVALGHRDGNVLVVGNDINEVQDLKGKSFAIPHKFSTHNVLLNQMLEQNGLQYEDVNVIELPPAEMPAALSEGRISGYVVAEPFGAISVQIGNGKVLYQDQDIWQNSLDCVLVLRSDFIESESKAAEEFVAQYVQGGELAELKDDHTHEVSSKYMKVEKDVMDLSLQWISYDDLHIQEQPYKELVNSITSMGLFEDPPTYEEFVNNTLIDKAK